MVKLNGAAANIGQSLFFACWGENLICCLTNFCWCFYIKKKKWNYKVQQQKHLLRIKTELVSLECPQRAQATMLDYSAIIPLLPLTFVKSLWNDGGESSEQRVCRVTLRGPSEELL